MRKDNTGHGWGFLETATLQVGLKEKDWGRISPNACLYQGLAWPQIIVIPRSHSSLIVFPIWLLVSRTVSNQRPWNLLPIWSHLALACRVWLSVTAPSCLDTF